MTIDIVTALFELGAGTLFSWNVWLLRRDKHIAGVSPWPTFYCTIWSVWTLWLYFSLRMWLAFAGSFAVIAPQIAWLILLAIYSFGKRFSV